MAELGHPYLWVQSLGGLKFPSDAPEVCVCGPPIAISKLSAAMVCFFLSLSLSVCVLSLPCVFQGLRAGSSLSASHMESTMKLLRGRVQSRLALQKQFSSLGIHTPGLSQTVLLTFLITGYTHTDNKIHV